MSEWQPIETAPKDRDVLIGHSDGSIMVARRNRSDTGWDDGDFHDHMDWPTHRMPLPSLPNA